jgi:hypothetical protein
MIYDSLFSREKFFIAECVILKNEIILLRVVDELKMLISKK